jgi:hypothetical protein
MIPADSLASSSNFKQRGKRQTIDYGYQPSFKRKVVD